MAEYEILKALVVRHMGEGGGGPMQTARGFLEAAAEVERKWR